MTLDSLGGSTSPPAARLDERTLRTIATAVARGTFGV
jgi:hypothetical protein